MTEGNLQVAIYVILWLEKWYRQHEFWFSKHWESFRRQKECFHNDGNRLTGKFAMEIEEGIEAFFSARGGWRRS